MTDKNGAITEARNTLTYILRDIEWQPYSVSKKLVETTLKRLDDEVINKVPDALNVWLEGSSPILALYNPIHRSATILADALRKGGE